MFKKYYCIKQHDITDCGAACIATISKQHGFRTYITKIREVSGTDKQGTNAYGVIKAAEQLRFSAKGVREIKMLSSQNSTTLLRMEKCNLVLINANK